MKKLFNVRFFGVCFSLILIFNVKAQNPAGWIHEGATWSFRYLQGLNGLLDISYAGVVQINGIEFQKLSGTKNQFYPQPNGSYLQTGNTLLDDMLFLTSNDSIYIRKENGALQFVWNLNPQVGDIWSFGSQIDYFTSISAPAFSIVESVQNLDVNGFQTKQITTIPCLDEFGTLPDFDDTNFINLYGSQINSALGPIFYFLEIGQFFLEPSQNIIDFFGSGLLCYQSDDIPLYQWQSVIDCNNGYLTLDDLKIEKYSLYPNPTTSVFTISNLENIESYSIHDLKGNLLMESSIFPCDISDFSKGIFLVKFQTKDNLFFHRKLILQ